MSVEIRVPTLGESIVDATIATWLKHEGDSVKQGESVVELETDKVNVEVSAEQGGVLQQILKKEGETVSVGEVLAILGETAQQPAPQTSAPVHSTSAQEQSAPVAAAQPPVNGQQASPLARRIASEHEVDLTQVRGSSPRGRITKDDVLSYMEQAAAPRSPVAPPVGAPQQPVAPPQPPVAPAAKLPVQTTAARREERVRLSRRRQTIAQRLVEAQHTAAMLTTFNEVDMSAIMDVRSRRKDAFKERHTVSLGFMSFFTKAVVGALKAFPRLNAEMQGDEMILKYYYDIGIAVGAEEGLVVPVVRDADRKSFAEIEREIAELANRARENKLTLADLQGGTFTITNGGVFGSLLSTPILNGPQVGILGMHKIEQRPVVVNGQIAIRPMMYLAVSYDHRIVDGREAVQFLVRVKELLEDPETLLLEG